VHLQQRFDATDGTDTVFRSNDGSNSPLADVSTVAARQSAYSMLPTKGLIRITLSIRATAEYTLAAVGDPYGYAGGANGLSLFRRPLPTTNLAFQSTVMWDGRETFRDPTSGACLKAPLDTSACFVKVAFDLSDQANGATLRHARATAPLPDAQRTSIATFELGLFTAQVFDAGGRQSLGPGAAGHRVD
jgi:cytochrome c peroxidase